MPLRNCPDLFEKVHFSLEICYLARVYVIYFVPHANSLDKSSQCTRRPKPLLDKKLQIPGN